MDGNLKAFDVRVNTVNMMDPTIVCCYCVYKENELHGLELDTDDGLTGMLGDSQPKFTRLLKSFMKSAVQKISEGPTRSKYEVKLSGLPFHTMVVVCNKEKQKQHVKIVHNGRECRVKMWDLRIFQLDTIQCTIENCGVREKIEVPVNPKLAKKLKRLVQALF